MKILFSNMKCGSMWLLAAGLLPVFAAAQEAPAPARFLMQEMAGVYKHRFISGIVVPGKEDEAHPVEDVVEIVPFDKEHIYVRTRLNFYNGHRCAIAVMARYENGAFVYRDREPAPAGLPQCVMKVGIEKGKLSISDRIRPDGERSCNKYCGVRGSMNTTVGMDRRRPIRYMERLKASRHYQLAIDELRAAQP